MTEDQTTATSAVVVTGPTVARVKPVKLHTSVAARVVSAILAIVLAPIGLGVLIYAGGLSYHSSLIRGQVVTEPLGIILGLLGIIILLIVVQTAHSSSLGLGIVSIVFAVAGIVGLPFYVVGEPVVQAVTGGNQYSLQSSEFWAVFGLMLTLAVLFGFGGLAAHRVRQRAITDSRTAPRIVSMVIALILTPVALAVVFLGAALYSSSLNTYVNTMWGGIAVLLVGELVLIAVLLTGLRSGAGLILTGAIHFILGMLGLIFVPVAANFASFYSFLAGATPLTARSVYGLGFVAAFGAILLATGVVLHRVRQRAVQRRAVQESSRGV